MSFYLWLSAINCIYLGYFSLLLQTCLVINRKNCKTFIVIFLLLFLCLLWLVGFTLLGQAILLLSSIIWWVHNFWPTCEAFLAHDCDKILSFINRVGHSLVVLSNNLKFCAFYLQIYFTVCSHSCLIYFYATNLLQSHDSLSFVCIMLSIISIRAWYSRFVSQVLRFYLMTHILIIFTSLGGRVWCMEGGEGYLHYYCFEVK